MVTQAGLTVAKWPDLQLPRPGHKANRVPSRWFGAADAGGPPELGRVTGRAGGGTGPEASRFRRRFQVRLMDGSKLALARPASSTLPQARETEVRGRSPSEQGAENWRVSARIPQVLRAGIVAQFGK